MLRAALLLLGLLLAGQAQAQPSEDAVKAAFLPKFIRYVTFPTPPAPGQPYYLCLIGRDPFGQQIDRATAGELVDGHAVVLRRFPSADSPAVAGCHLAWLAGQTDAATGAMIERLRGRPTLTVTDARVGRRRGIIHFTVVDGRVRFHIDDVEAAARGIAISSRLLALAVEVRQRAP